MGPQRLWVERKLTIYFHLNHKQNTVSWDFLIQCTFQYGYLQLNKKQWPKHPERWQATSPWSQCVPLSYFILHTLVASVPQYYYGDRKPQLGKNRSLSLINLYFPWSDFFRIASPPWKRKHQHFAIRRKRFTHKVLTHPKYNFKIVLMCILREEVLWIIKDLWPQIVHMNSRTWGDYISLFFAYSNITIMC